MEIYSNTTRFALACNLSNKIIEPIQSRCAILRYSKLADAEVMKRLQEIVEMEKVRLEPFVPSVDWESLTRVPSAAGVDRGLCDRHCPSTR